MAIGVTMFTDPVPPTVDVFFSLCQQVQAENSLTRKSELIQGCVRRWGGDLLLLFKMLLPKYTGRIYNLKDKQMMKLLSGLLKTHESTLKDHADKSGCIATTAVHFFHPAGPRGGMSLADLEGHLAALAAVTTEDQQRRLMGNFIAAASRDELFIYLREIKLDLRLGAGIRIVLNGLHASANDIYKQCASIAEVVKRVMMGDTNITSAAADDDDDDGASDRSTSPSRIRGGKITASIAIGTPLSPMLAAPSRGAASVVAKCPNGVYSETKYDGERIQIHKKGSEFSFYARSTKAMKPDKYEGLEKFIMSAVKATDCILDGEILLVDTRTSQPLPFGTLGKHKKAQFTTANTAIFLFDILYLDGTPTLTMPLDERRNKMREVVDIIPNRIMFSDLRIITGTKDEQTIALNRHLQFAITTGLEGLVCKDRKSVYGPGTRHWIKLKKDYLEGMGDSADLILLGAWYGSGARAGKLSTFLMGVLDTAASDNAPKRFKTVTSVSNGFEDSQLDALQPAFQRDMTKTNGTAPYWLDVTSSNIPDMVYRDPNSAPVYEIMCNEYTTSTMHTADSISMRFGRIIRIRDDKDVRTATSLQYLHQLVAASKAPGPGDIAQQQKLAAQAGEIEGDVVSSYVAPPPGSTPAAAAPVHRAAAAPVSPPKPAKAPGLTQPKLAFPKPAGAPSTADSVAAGWAMGGAPTAAVPAPAPPSASPARRDDRGASGGASPPLRRAATAIVSGPVESHGELLRTVNHDVSQPIPVRGIPESNLIIVHVAAIGGRWSNRGVMGAITRTHGDECKDAYDGASAKVKLGDLVVVEISNRLTPGRLFVATIIGQTMPAPGAATKAPQTDHDALTRGLEKAAKFARKSEASIHFARPDRSTGVKWGEVEKVIKTSCTDHRVHVTIYSREAAPSSSSAPVPPTSSTPSLPTATMDPPRARRASPPLPPSGTVGSTPRSSELLPATATIGGAPIVAAAPGTARAVFGGCRIVITTGDPDEGHLTKRQGEAAGQKAQMLGAASVAVQPVTSPCPPGTTHIVADGKVPATSIIGKCFIVERAWVDSSFAEDRRADESKYRSGAPLGALAYADRAAPAATTASPPPRGRAVTAGELVPRGSVGQLFDVMSAYRVVVSPAFAASERSELKTKVQSMGGTPQDSWAVLGIHKSTHFVAAGPSDSEGARVASLGGTVVSRRWLDQNFERATVHPADAFTLRFQEPAPMSPAAADDSDDDAPPPPAAARRQVAPAAQQPQPHVERRRSTPTSPRPHTSGSPPMPAAHHPTIPTGPAQRARTPETHAIAKHVGDVKDALHSFVASSVAAVPAVPPAWHKYQAAVAGYDPDLAAIVKRCVGKLGIQEAASANLAQLVFSDTACEASVAAAQRHALVLRLSFLHEAAATGAMPEPNIHRLFDGTGRILQAPATSRFATPLPVITMESVDIKSTNAPPSIGKQQANAAADVALSPAKPHHQDLHVGVARRAPVIDSDDDDSPPPIAKRDTRPRATSVPSASSTATLESPPPTRRIDRVTVGDDIDDAASDSTMSYHGPDDAASAATMSDGAASA